MICNYVCSKMKDNAEEIANQQSHAQHLLPDLAKLTELPHFVFREIATNSKH